jgi:hypothetical protein
MRVAIELYNSSDCLLDSRIVEVAEGGDFDGEITKAMYRCVAEWSLGLGDTIRITELL